MLLFVLLQEVTTATVDHWVNVGASLAAALAVFAGSWGIGKIGKTALESIARQPEAGNDIRQAMIISAALIEGITFFAIVVCFLVLFV
jgi:F-type H+-transporting ATPase subunit c